MNSQKDMNIRKVLMGYQALGRLFNFESLKEYSYEISNLEYYKKISISDPTISQKIYCEEILQRAHLAAVSSILRNLKWINGVNSSIENVNLLSFTANLRGLIESCCDTFDSLNKVPMNLANNFEVLERALEGDIGTNEHLNFKELEDNLIHFAYGRKINAFDRDQMPHIPKSHNAKAVKDCLEKLDGKEFGPLTKLYSLLCQFCHPAAHSIHYFYELKEDQKSSKFTYLIDTDERNIEQFLTLYSNEIIIATNIGLNSSLVVLKTLNFFNYIRTKTSFLDSIQLNDVELWQKVKAVLQMNT